MPDHGSVGYTPESGLLVPKYVKLYLQKYIFLHEISNCTVPSHVSFFFVIYLSNETNPVLPYNHVILFFLFRRGPFLESGKDPVPGEVTIPRNFDF
jgi:hypothetical protein